MNKTGLQAAVEAAAKVKAKLIAKGKLVQSTPPLRPQPLYTKSNDAVFTAKMTINDCSVMVRNLLTKGSVQEEICKNIDGSISTKGRYIAPGDSHDNDGERPLYLYIQGTTQVTVNKIMSKINELIKENGGTILESIITSQPMTTHHYVQDKVFFKSDNVNPMYNLKEKILGPNEKYLQHIRTETSSTVVLRGKGSGHIEPMSGQEAFEPLHLHIVSKTNECLEKAKALATNLIETVQMEYAQWYRNQQAIGIINTDFQNYSDAPYGPLPQGHTASSYPIIPAHIGPYQNMAPNSMVVSYPMMAPCGPFPNSYPTPEPPLSSNPVYPVAYPVAGYQDPMSMHCYPSPMPMGYPPTINYPSAIGSSAFSHPQAKNNKHLAVPHPEMTSAKENTNFPTANLNIKNPSVFKDENEFNSYSKFKEVTFAVPLSLARKKRESNSFDNNFPEHPRKLYTEEESFSSLKIPRLQKDAAPSSQSGKRLMPPPPTPPKISTNPLPKSVFSTPPPDHSSVEQKEATQPTLTSALQGLQGYGSDSESDEC